MLTTFLQFPRRVHSYGKPLNLLSLSLILSASAFGNTAKAEIRVGVIVSTTGPAASLGIPEKNTVALLPTKIGKQDISYIILDDASNSTTAVKNITQLIQQDNVDIVIGSSTTPVSLAMLDVAASNKVPMIALGSGQSIVAPVDDKRYWIFKAPQNDSLMAAGIANYMKKSGIKTVGFIGFNDASGDLWYNELQKNAAKQGISVTGNERYQRTDTDLTKQASLINSLKPDAVFIGASGLPALLPQQELRKQGYTGQIYQTHGVANPEFLSAGGKDVEGTILPAGPLLVADQLPDYNPIKKVGLNYIFQYQEKYGQGSVSTFGGHIYDAGLLIKKAIPQALKKGQPGTPEFRAALRDALENTRNVIGTQGIFNIFPDEHQGLNARARVMLTIENGTWKLLK